MKISKLFVLGLILFLTYTVKADYPSCLTSIARGEKNDLTIGDTVVIVFGNDNSATNMFIYRYNYNFWYDSNVFEIVKENNHYINPISDWRVVSEDVSRENYLSFVVETNNKTKMVAGNNNVLPNAIASVKLKVKSLTSDWISNNVSRISLEYPSYYTYYLSNSPYTDPDYEESDEINCESSSVTLYLKNDTKTLSSIKIDGQEIKGFNENTTGYNISVDGNRESINIEATKKDNKSSVSGDLGTKGLKYGINTFKIIVTSEAGSKNTYTLNINRPDVRSSINTLSTLKLSTGIINFKPEIIDYTINVSNDVDTIKIESTLTDPKSSYVTDFGNREIELLEGGNKVLIKIVAENGDENTYTININRALSGDNKLGSLYVNGESIELSNRVFNYTYEVENDVTSVIISAYPNNNDATVEIGNLSLLEVGDNEVTITVIARNGNKATYNLNVIRKAKISNEPALKNIIIEGYDLDFEENKTYYDLKIKKEDNLVITPVTIDESTTVTIEGNQDLINGSVIRLTARKTDGSVTRYFINISKGEKFNILWLIIGIIVFIIIALVALIIILLKRKKKNQENQAIDNEVVSPKNEELSKDVDSEEKINQEEFKEKSKE